jgi:arylsulfatase A-like enzyme
MTDRPNVLLVILDSVRARNTSLHDHCHDTTPALSSFAENATVYTQARAPDRWSLPSHASLFTGLSKPEHGVTERGDRLRAGNSIFSELAADGYATGVFSENPFLTTLDTGLDDGFETVEGKSTDPLYPDAVNPQEFKGDVGGFLKTALASGRPVRSLANGLTAKLAWDYPGLLPESLAQRIGGVSRGDRYTDLFLEWQADRDGPWAACLNYMDAHHPYAPQDAYDEWADDSVAAAVDRVGTYPGSFYTGETPVWRCELAEFLYDGTIRQVDAELARLFGALDRRGDLADTFVVVTADHGEGFGERSRLRPLPLAGHAVGGHEVNLHVPLVVKTPGQRDGHVVTDPVSLTGFPDAVRAGRDGEDGNEPFTPQDRIVATGSEPDGELLEKVETAGLETDQLAGDVDVVYEANGDGTVTKHVRWNGRTRVVEVVDSRTAVERDRPAAATDTVEAVFEGLHDAGVVERSDGDDISAETKQRLEDLGYR